MAKQEIEMHGLEDQVDEMDFGSIGKTLSKYGKGVPKDDPKKVSRSTVHTDYTMTGHKEKKSGTGRVYTKVLADYDDDAGKAAKATQAPDQVEAPKRGRGRPAGALNKNGSGVTGKGWSAEAKASMKAKLAARKAAKLASAKNESTELDEAGELKHHVARVSYHKKDDPHRRYEAMFKTTHGLGKQETEKRAKAAFLAKNKIVYNIVHESEELTEEDWADITEGQSLDAIVEFMMDEEYQSLDELSKKTLGSYIKKAKTDVARKFNHINDLDSEGSDYEDTKDSRAAAKKYKEADTLQKKQQQRINNVGKAEIKLRNESKELAEAHNGTFKVGDVVSVDYHDISGKTHHGTANVDKSTNAFVHVRHPSVSGMTLKFHQTVNGKPTANEVGTLPGTRAGGHRITKLGTNESSVDLNIKRYAALIGKNLIKE